MRLSRLIPVVCLLALPALALGKNSPWQTGTYLLAGGKWDVGVLTIHESEAETAIFSIETSNCLGRCGTDRSINHVGGIDQDTMEILGSVGRYRSAGPDEETQAPELGICVLQFAKLKRHTIKVTQLGNCWWFGQGVSVSGTYKLKPNHAAK